MKKALVLCFLAFTAAMAQNAGKISGRIVDARTKEPLPSVNVVVAGTTLGASTDLDGAYFILNLAPGVYSLKATIVGYTPMSKTGVQVDIGRTTRVDFALTEGTIDAKTVEVVAERPVIEKEKTSTSEIIRTEEVKEIPGVRDLNGVLGLAADVSDGHFRGGREGEELYTLSGMGIVNPLTSSSAFAPLMSAVEEVEVVTSGFGAQYGNAQSGVVNISMKEGRSDRWRAHADFRTRFPGYKHFGAGVFDRNANPYLQMLGSPDKWLGLDSSATSPQSYYSSIGYGFDQTYKSAQQAASIAYALWKQARRDLDRQYNDLWDYSVEANIGGPLSGRARLFLATRVEKEWQVIPAAEPDYERQIMGNVAYDFGDGFNARLSGAYTFKTGHLYPGLGSTSYTSIYNWLWDRVLGLPGTRDENSQIGLRAVWAPDRSTFWELKVNYLSTRYADGVLVGSPYRYISDDLKTSAWLYFNTPDGFRTAQMDNDFRDERTNTVSVDASVNSQLSNEHLVLAGLQFNSYNINVNNKINLSSAGNERLEKYKASPYELGLYVQDKMEFEGMIANVGLRLDVYNQNVDYYTDGYSPFRIMTSDTTYYYDPNAAGKSKTPVIGRLQPRLGLSFPVSTSTVFHLNYGSFLQRPAFERTVYLRLPQNNYNSMTLGNPRLRPQDTKSYDVGIMQALGESFTLDVSGYYKDVKNLIQRAFYYDAQSTSYSTFINRDYADIRGFAVKVAKRKGMLTGSLKYNYGVATGSSSTPFLSTPVYYEKPPAGGSAAVLPSPKDITLDFDRTHSLLLTMTFAAEESWGPSIGDIYPLERVTVAVNSFARSGRPYTYDTQGLGLINNHRSPAEYNTDLKISKRIRKVFGAELTVYVEIMNLFNQKRYSFNSVFGTATQDNSASTITNQNVRLYETNPDLLHYYSATGSFYVDQDFLIYGNSPRSYFAGIALNF